MAYGKFPGRTKLGQTVNKTQQKTNSIKTNRIKYKYGRIVEASNTGGYRFKIEVLKENGSGSLIVGPIRMIETDHDLAARFGSPEEMVEDGLMVMITYSGSTPKATVIKDLDNIFPGGEAEKTMSANDLPVQGTAFAPPGSSMI